MRTPTTRSVHVFTFLRRVSIALYFISMAAVAAAQDDLGAGRSTLTPPRGAPFPEALGILDLKIDGDRQVLGLDLEGVEPRSRYGFSFESRAGSPVFIGELRTDESGHGYFTLDTGRGDLLPAGIESVEELAGHAARVDALGAEKIFTVVAGKFPAIEWEDIVEPEPPRSAVLRAELTSTSGVTNKASQGKVFIEAEGTVYTVHLALTMVAPETLFKLTLDQRGATAELHSLKSDENGAATAELTWNSLPFGAQELGDLESTLIEVFEGDDRVLEGKLVLEQIPPTTKAVRFLRGDANHDQVVDLSDAVTILSVLFLGDAEIRCADGADANDDGTIDLSDPQTILNYLFIGMRAPPAPGPFTPGEDPSEDALGCAAAE